ncbi:hypothetical protein BD779DRAFT_1675669 [Infundibulicybe gibba]|nr:hypothetical protein BD779DRAFT_1675669 [Infundibulicybe gibba]
MTDLTVLVSPTPLYPAQRAGFAFGRGSPRPVSRPIMVTLETESESPEEEADTPKSQLSWPSKGRRASTDADSSLLSPPANTWKAQPQPKPRPRHRPTRSQSAPPERTLSREEKSPIIETFPATIALRPKPKRNFTAFTTGTTRGGELVRPPPPLLRPTTFWRKNRRSGVTGASYSPSYHLIRRSTFIAAGLTFDAPIHDLSAFCVESRVGFIVIPPEQKFQ